jgi:hypothetical protein
MDNEVKYCPKECIYLSITEKQQDRLKHLGVLNKECTTHMCTKYHKRVVHGAHHPELIRLSECKE